MPKIKFLILLTIVCILLKPLTADNFTSGTRTAQKFGMHEISLTGDVSVSNPFDIAAAVTFTPPSGQGNARTVQAFYDGGNTWRARVYVSETGSWNWSSSSGDDAGLNNANGSFEAVDSELRGKLRKHPDNNTAWMTDNGKWFLNIGDTPYYLFHSSSTGWQDFIRDSWEKGVSSLRCCVLGALRGRQADWIHDPDGWPLFFTDNNYDRFVVENFQRDDARLQWMLNNYPGMYVQLIMIPESNTGWTQDETFWRDLSQQQRDRLKRYLVARYAAYPQIFWLICNDYGFSSGLPNNAAMVNEIGSYLEANDPWANLISAGRNRGQPFYFTDASWAGYFHLETLDALFADQIDDYSRYPVHVFCGEDRYEDYRPPRNPGIFFRRLIWSWTLSGGSACYGGDYSGITPYNQTSFIGLDNTIHIRNFFSGNNIELSGYLPDDGSVNSGATGTRRPKVMRTAENTAYVIYHPNASADGENANTGSGTASLTVSDLPSETYAITWMRADDGTVDTASFIHAGGDKLLACPWAGTDAALFLRNSSVTSIKKVMLPGMVNSIKVTRDPFRGLIRITVSAIRPILSGYIAIYDINGRLLKKTGILEKTGEAGITWETGNHPNGMYIIKAKINSDVHTESITLLK